MKKLLILGVVILVAIVIIAIVFPKFCLTDSNCSLSECGKCSNPIWQRITKLVGLHRSSSEIYVSPNLECRCFGFFCTEILIFNTPMVQ